MSPLDPRHLTPANSMNRVRIVDLPGLDVDPEVKGRLSGELVSAAALARLLRENAAVLRLDPDQEDHALRLSLDRCFTSELSTVRGAAVFIGRRLGRNLGYVLLALRRGDPVNRAVREEWDDSYWQHWQRINRVWIGGGLVSGRLGPLIRDHAAIVFDEAGVEDYTINLSSYGAFLPLVGAARCAPAGAETALVFDFGHTVVKRARAAYNGGTLVGLRRLPSWSTGWGAQPESISEAAAAKLLDYVVEMIAHTWRIADLEPSSPVLASVAAYIRDGHPLEAGHGAYMHMRRVTDNLQAELTRRVSEALGQPVEVTLVHDGTAAALAYAGAANAAVVTIGTALGVGFPPGDGDHLRGLNGQGILAP
jgi:hypothetical protein